MVFLNEYSGDNGRKRVTFFLRRTVTVGEVGFGGLRNNRGYLSNAFPRALLLSPCSKRMTSELCEWDYADFFD